MEAVVCGSPLFLYKMVKKSKYSDLKIGAQNMHFESSGAFTGEVSPHAIQELGVEYVILGHSERRELFGETDELVNKKVLTAFSHELLPIVCCGESVAEREAGQTESVVTRQVQAAFAGLSTEQAKQVVIAYEPIWAIGTGMRSSATDANIVCGQIREVVAGLFDTDVASSVRIQYGGSVKPDNIADYLAMEHIDGALVGGASLEVESFLAMLFSAKVCER